MAVIRSTWPKSVIKSHIARVDDRGIQIDKCVAAIDGALVSRPSNERGVFVGSFIGLGHFYGLLGSVSLAAGNQADGWRDILKSVRYSLASLKIQSGMGMPACDIGDTASACSIFCTALVLNYVQVRDWTANLIVNSYQTSKGLIDLDYTPFSLLVVQMAAEHLGVSLRTLPPAKEHAGFYEPVLIAPSVAEMQTAIESLAIDRVKLVLETHSDYPPFEYSPFDLWPVDLMAVAKVRFPEHAFTYGVLESPLCHPPNPLPFVPDPLIDRVLARCRESMTIAEVEWC